MNEEAPRLKNQLYFPLYACAKEVARKYQPMLKAIGLTYTQYIVMMVLWERRKVSVRELGEQLYLDSGTLTPLLKRLEAQGLVTRERSIRDERSVIVSLTGRGDMLREKAGDISDRMGRCLSLDQEESKTLYTLLYRVLGAVSGS